MWVADVSQCGAEEDDITGILNVFCKHLAHDKSGKWALRGGLLFLDQRVCTYVCNLQSYSSPVAPTCSLPCVICKMRKTVSYV